MEKVEVERRGGHATPALTVRVIPFTPRVSYGEFKMILSFESVDEILWCDHSNETSSAVLLHGTIYI